MRDACEVSTVPLGRLLPLVVLLSCSRHIQYGGLLCREAPSRYFKAAMTAFQLIVHSSIR